MTRNFNLNCVQCMFVGLVLAGCRELGLPVGTPRERYERGLAEAGLDQTALGMAWMAAGNEALAQPVEVTLPFSEAGYVSPEHPRSTGYRFEVSQGQRVLVHLQVTASEPARVFLEFFSAVDSSRPPEHLVSADSGETGIDVEIEESGGYQVRVQPELLRSMRYTLTIRASPVLAFPVQGVGNDAIRSRYGADRDAGRRRHEGIDIFAPRGTPVLAATRGRVVNVGDNRLGGRVVWLHDDERNQNLYYAHLDQQIAVEGQRVERGDTIGLVGNTGNARTTPPHLHFGIYRRGRGTVDPFPFVFRTATRAPPIRGDTSHFGSWVRVAARRAVLSQPGMGPDTLDLATVMRVLGAADTRYRVELPDKRIGFLSQGSVQSALTPVSRQSIPTGGRILERPAAGAVMVDTLRPGSTIEILGEFAGFLLVNSPGGPRGWVPR